MNRLRLAVLWILLGSLLADGAFAEVPATSQPGSCDYFFEALHAIPHKSLSRRHGKLTSTWDGTPFQGCEVSFVTQDALLAGKAVPTFEAFPDNELYRMGWRMVHSIGADGPGSGIFAVEQETTQCVIRWAQPAYLADSGEIMQSDNLAVTIQCRNR